MNDIMVPPGYPLCKVCHKALKCTDQRHMYFLTPINDCPDCKFSVFCNNNNWMKHSNLYCQCKLIDIEKAYISLIDQLNYLEWQVLYYSQENKALKKTTNKLRTLIKRYPND